METVMKRYSFPVPEWCRTLWVSDVAKELWAPRLQQISQSWGTVERASVGFLRAACIQSVGTDQIDALSMKAAQSGLSLLILKREGVGGGAVPVEYSEGQPFSYRIALVEREHTESFMDAWLASDDDIIGNMLGFPPCCRKFFQRVWKDEGWIDTTWPMAMTDPINPPLVRLTEPVVDVAGPVECNILLRWLGVRWVTHLPCSFDCEATVMVGQNFRALMQQMGLLEEIEWMDELLNTSIEWSSLHGIAEIKHPLFKVSTKTDAVEAKLVVRREGKGYPQLGARGNDFPYQRHIENSKPLVFVKDSQSNGFSTKEAMNSAHDVICSHVQAYNAERVLDLGCGTGALVRRIVGHGFAAGVEIDPTRAIEAQKHLDQVYAGNMFDPQALALLDELWSFVLLMPGRLLEVPEHAEALRTKLGRHTIVAYVYDEQNILQLCESAKLLDTHRVTEAQEQVATLVPK